jgi:hypothetical protein
VPDGLIRIISERPVGRKFKSFPRYYFFETSSLEGPIMNENLRKHHRLIKVIMAVILSSLGYILNIWPLYLIALIFLIMAIANFCPADYFEKKGKSQKKTL